MTFNQEKEEERKRFILFLYRRFIRLKNTIMKIREQSEELNDDDIAALEPYYAEFYQLERKGNGN